MSNYKFELHDRIRVKNTRLEGVVKGRHTYSIKEGNTNEVRVRYTVVLDVLGRSQLLWYEEDCLVSGTIPISKQARNLMVLPKS